MSGYFRIPDPGVAKFCGVCGGEWPDGHRENCPIKTGIPVRGQPGFQKLLDHQQQALYTQNQLMSNGLMGEGSLQQNIIREEDNPWRYLSDDQLRSILDDDPCMRQEIIAELRRRGANLI